MSESLGRLLAQPLRHRLLLEYSLGSQSPAEVARRLGEPLNLVSYHTGVLARHGYVALVRTERRRGALTRYYRSTVDTIIEDREWAQLPHALRRALVAGTLEQAIGEARRAAHDGGFDAARSHISRSPLELDDEACAAVAACLRAALAELEAIVAASRERAGGPRTLYEVVMLGFQADAAELPAD
jgi:DNA-binding transcriptional ArsR family regulator